MSWTPSADRCEGEYMCRRPLDWRESTAEEFADVIEGLCVEKEGKCACDPCRCRNYDVAEEGEW